MTAMIQWSVEHRENTTCDTGVLILQGEATIESVGELKEVLLEMIRQRQTVIVDCEQLKGADLSFLQLCHSAQRTAAASSKQLSVTGHGLEALTAAVESLGFPQEGTFWRTAQTEDGR